MALMALTATLSAVVSSAAASSNKPRIGDKERSNGRITTRLAAAAEDKGRRGLLLSSVLLASQLNDSQAQLLQSIYIYIYIHFNYFSTQIKVSTIGDSIIC